MKTQPHCACGKPDAYVGSIDRKYGRTEPLKCEECHDIEAMERRERFREDAILEDEGTDR